MRGSRWSALFVAACSWLATTPLAGPEPQAGELEGVEEVVRRARDRVFRRGYDESRVAAEALRDLGSQRGDDLLRARGLAMLAYVELYHRHWSNGSSYLFSEHDEAGADTPYDHSFSGFMDLSRLSLPLGQSDIYLCGPLPFMRAQRRFLLDQGVEPERIHYEVFGPDLLSGLA